MTTSVPSDHDDCPDLEDSVPFGIRESDAQSPNMRALMTLAARVAPLDSTVLITGESGVGKEWLARWLHKLLRRARGPYVAVNCPAFPDTLLKTELFGHVRGAFTGAVKDRPGRFEVAHGGTLFWTKSATSTRPCRSSSCACLKNARSVASVRTPSAGSIFVSSRRPTAIYRMRSASTDFGWICTTGSKSGISMCRRYASVLRTCVSLANQFLVHTAATLRRPVIACEPDALDRILRYSWPGNIRELKRAVERACGAATGSIIGVDDLPIEVSHAVPAGERQRGGPACDCERNNVLNILERHHGDRVRAAAELGISLSTLKRRLRRTR
jgi:two-component system response regulator HydG